MWFKKQKIIIIGAGINGLSAALTLSKLGKEVTIIEQDKAIGGLARHAEFCYGLPKEIKNELFRGGYRLGRPIKTEVIADQTSYAIIAPTFFGNGTKLQRASNDLGELKTGRRHHRQFEQRMQRIAKLWRKLIIMPPPKLEGGDLSTFSKLAKMGLQFKLWRKKHQYDFLKIIAQNSDDVINEALAEQGLATLTSLWNFHAYHGSGSFATMSGSMVSLWTRMAADVDLGLTVYDFNAEKFFQAYEKILKKRKITLLTNKSVTAITTTLENRETIAKGVVLSDGNSIMADAVLSTLSPDRTIALLGEQEFDGELVRRAKQVRGRGLVAHIQMQLKTIPQLLLQHGKKGKKPEMRRIVITGGRRSAELQYLAAKYDHYPETFPLVLKLIDNKLIGQVFHIPVNAKPDANKLKNLILAQLKTLMPDINIGKVELTLPSDMVDYAGGVKAESKPKKAAAAAWHHADLVLDQFWAWRPINGAATGESLGFSHYQTPIKGCYVGGAACHPGGDLAGYPGILAAKTLAKNWLRNK